MLEFPIYLPDSSEPEGVIPWGKPPELRAQDTAAGVARIGGDRWANYDQAYLLSANTLFEAAKANQSLDHHGLPIFYLQRHAAELMMKDMLLLALDIQKWRAEIGTPSPIFPKNADQKNRIEGKKEGHRLPSLLQDLREMAEAMEVSPVPSELTQAIEEINAIEQHRETWSRYSVGRIKAPDGSWQSIQHLEQEVVLPLGRLNDLLQAANKAIGSLWPAEGMLGELGELHQDAMRYAGQFD